MKRKLPFILVPVTALLAVIMLVQPGAQMTDAATGTSRNMQSNSAGMKLHIDPVTKQIVDAAAEPLTPDGFENLQSLFNTSHVGLVEVDGPVGGGKMVDLKGRFQHAYTASIDASGDLSAGCGIHESAKETNPEDEKESD
jgi:hypothetical protein